MDLSVIIVSYNTRDLTLECLRSVFAETRDLEYEVIVVENASGDGSAEAIHEEFPEVRLFALDENLGFAGGNNLGAAEARGRYVLLLNPDTVVLGRALEHLVRFMDDHPEAGLCGGRTRFADGSLNPTSCWGSASLWSLICRGTGLRSVFPGSRWFDPESLGNWERDSRREVDIVSGCLMILPREFWDELEGFDLRFFMYAEDFDLSWRVKERGRSLWIIPEATIIHHGGASERVRADKIVRLFTANCQLYRKHWSPLRARCAARLYDLWAGSRALAFTLLSPLSRRARVSRANWCEIWRRRAAWHRDPESAVPART